MTTVPVDHGARAEELVAATGGRRDRLEELRASFQDRLRRASDDFDATDGLRVVEAALALVPRTDPPGWQARERRTGGEARGAR